KRTVVSEDQIYVLTVAKRSEKLQAVNRGQVIRFEPEPVIVKLGQRLIRNFWRVVTVDSRACSFYYSSGLILEPRLCGGNFARLGRTHSAEILLTLPASPRKFVIVPHTNERPSSPRVLQIRIEQIRAVHRSIVFYRCRDMEVADLFTRFVANDVAQSSAVHS